MAISSRTVFAIIICLLGSLEMASSWQSNCIPGDIYMDATAFLPLPPGTTFKDCNNWCDVQCSILGLPPVKYGSRTQKDNIRCKCCCGSSPPSPGSPPSPALPPPAPQSPSEFEGKWPQEYPICTAGQKSLQPFEHMNGTDCIHKPRCEPTCKDMELSMARKECVSGGFIAKKEYRWYEQCCCETRLPPPPSPSPPPPSGDTCQLELNIQISPDLAPCNYKLSKSAY